MYTTFYNLQDKPFEITPDPRFLYLSENHREALAHLIYAVREKKGFTVITGEVGTGKTTLIQTLLSRLDGSVRTAFLFNPKLGPTDFLHSICEDFGIKGAKGSKGQTLNHLHQFLLECYGRGENVVLIIDEAQNLDPQLLEEVRMLTNLETPKNKLLQVILMGQPELNGVLNDTRYRQLKQRISLRYHLKPLTRPEVEEYIKARLVTAGASDTDLFTMSALERLYRYSKGIPRLINIVCDNALLAGYAADQRVIGPKIIGDVISNLEGGNGRQERNYLPWVVVSAAMLALVATAGLIWAGILRSDMFAPLVSGLRDATEAFLQKMAGLLSK
jgi:general secretion pathway protein A